MNIAVLGAWHVHTMEYSTALQKNPDSTLCCLWDSDPERGAQMAEKLGVPFQPDLDAGDIIPKLLQRPAVLL